MKRPEVSINQEVVLKTYPESPEGHELFTKEVYFYMHYPQFCPKMLGMNLATRTLVIEQCTPILDIENNEIYKEALSGLLQRLHDAGANHRDISLKNVVVRGEDVLLIDWENATTEVGEVSADLYSANQAGVEPQDPDVWWGGPWGHCPGVYWK